jgi:uncharacterized protein (DUF885 family)
MKKSFISGIIVFCLFCGCKSDTNKLKDNTTFNRMLDNYYEESLALSPIDATANGDNRYNDKMYVDFTDSFLKKTAVFYKNYLNKLTKFDRSLLNENDQISYDVLKRDLELNLEGMKYHDNYLPLNQIFSSHLFFAQLGSGSVIQPFETVKDYENWLKRMPVVAAYMDSCVVYFKKGIAADIVLPKSLVVKIIPQLQSFVTSDVTKSIFYEPIKKMPATFSELDKKRLTELYSKIIMEQVVPAYKRVGDFLQQEYLPKSRTTSGISSLAYGKEYYNYCIRTQTTTNKTPDEIYNIGLNEVKRIRAEMEKTKNQVGFKGKLSDFFEYMKTDKKFMPYKEAKEVLNAFQDIHKKMTPYLKNMFAFEPKTPFEIRQTEAFRAESASAEYNQGSADGKRPGIFYIPIVDATKFNITSGMESLFLHEAIPGHHYQISLQQENEKLPKFRRFGGNNAYAEGWALYCESLGKELGLYKDPYQYMGALSDEIHRAIRLVVDVAIHTKGMTREQAIAYMMENEPISEEGATAEIERYMAAPGQALGYKIGAIKIREIRNYCEEQLGKKFSLSDFHNAVLKNGNLPLDVLENNMKTWVNHIKNNPK